MESSKDLKKNKLVYDGSTDINNFLAKITLESSLKDYVDEKKANFLASRLVGPAFEVYMRLSAEHKKDSDQITTELKKEFERGQLNREEALSILGSRMRGSTESPHTFAYKLSELVKLAYPTFDDTVRKTIAKDYYMKGVHPDMQVALKSRASFEADEISTLASETVRLSLAGVRSYSKPTNPSSEICGSVDDVAERVPEQQSTASADMVNAIADVVVSRLRETSLVTEEDSNNVTVNNVNQQRGRGFGGRRGRGSRGFRRGGRNNNQSRRCRSCQSTDHLIRNCPNKFCEACGQRGHSQYDQTCLNYS